MSNYRNQKSNRRGGNGGGKQMGRRWGADGEQMGSRCSRTSRESQGTTPRRAQSAINEIIVVFLLRFASSVRTTARITTGFSFCC